MELIFAVPLLLSLIALFVLLGRVLTDRNRILAAERTLAWMITHDKRAWESVRTKEKELPQYYTSDEFALWLRDVHFGKGFLEVDRNRTLWRNGILARSIQRFSDQLQQARGAAESSMQMSDALTDLMDKGDNRGFHEKDSTASTESSAANLFDKLYGSIFGSLVSFLSGDAYMIEAHVRYAMPMTLPLHVYEFFFGQMEKAQMEERFAGWDISGQSYAWLSTVNSGGIVLPLIDSGGDVALQGPREQLGKLIKALMDKTSGDNFIYRPHNAARLRPAEPEGVSEIACQLEGLMYYEAYDQRHKYAKQRLGELELGWSFVKTALSLPARSLMDRLERIIKFERTLNDKN